ncbi:MAG TPA: hypothetical protein VFO76_06245 [Candidatus Kapabacteria bacterium]|nr:hypothetical protein [Candidatus Kapabacteria bacterium]
MAIVFILGGTTHAQNAIPAHFDQPQHSNEPTEILKSIEDLMHERLQRERDKYGSAMIPEPVRLEANYIRTDAPTGEVVLHEASFNIQPRYISISPEGRQKTDTTLPAAHAVMYYIGSARTPLSLPLVSNLTNVLSGEEASYTVYVGVMPLPRHTQVSNDSLRFYCIIERAIESNRTDREVKFERYAKEFSVKIGDPVRLRLENTPPDKQAYIVRLDNSQMLNFYEDFARHFNEDILLNGERLNFALGKATVSPISSRLSIKYTVAYPAHIKLDLVSVVDPAHPLTLIDSVVPPADYLAEHDMKQYPNGPYRYRLSVNELGSGKVIFDETKDFDKNEPVRVGQGISISRNDTLEVGGKKLSDEEALKALSEAYNAEKSKTERLDATITVIRSDNEKLKSIVEAHDEGAINGIKFRGGLGFGSISGFNLSVGVESSDPSLSLDLSYGVLYSGNVPYLAYDNASNFSQIFSSPKSLGLQIGWSPFKWFDGVVNPVAKFGYYGIYSAETPTTKGGVHSAAILSPTIGFAALPGGKNTSVGIDFTAGPAFGLGVNGGVQFDWDLKFYLKF